METTTHAHKLQWLAETGSPRSFVNPEAAKHLQKEIPNIKIQDYTENTTYRCFDNNNIDIKRVHIMDKNSETWSAKACRVLIVNNKTNNIMCRDLLSKLGITLNATKNTGKKTILISQLQTAKNIIKWVFLKYPNKRTRLGRSKDHIAKSIFKKEYTHYQHKGRQFPLHLLKVVENKVQKNNNDKQIKLDKCSDELFISPEVITVKNDDKTKEIALDSKKLNDAIHNNKYPMQSIDHLIDSVAVYISENKKCQANTGSQKLILNLHIAKFH